MKDDVQRILVACHMIGHCSKAVHYGVSLARTYDAQLYVLQVIHNPFSYEGWNLPVASLEEEYRRLQQKAKQRLDADIDAERSEGLTIEEIIKEGLPSRVIMEVIEEKKINLLVLEAHEEGHLEHFLFGRSNEELIRKMPCSIFLVKKRLPQAAW